MTRRPSGRGAGSINWESWVDRQIREGQANGEFDDLPGHGRPIADIDNTNDEMWWVRRKMREEGISYLPPALAVRKDRDEMLDAIAGLSDETEVRRRIDEVNDKIRNLNRYPHPGPPSTLVVLDVDRVVGDWRAGLDS